MEGIQATISPFDWQIASRPPSGDSPERIRETAQQFESILLGMMLKSMREASGGSGWLGAGEDQSLLSISELAEQQVAQALAASGGMGLASMVEDGLNRARVEARIPAGPEADG